MFGLRCLLPAVVECFLVRFIAFFRVRAALLSACRRGALFSPFKRFFRVRLFSLRLRLQSGLNRLIRPLCRGRSAAQNLSSGKLFIASLFKLSIARVYFSVCASPLCPKRLATVFMLAPRLRIFTANECRAQCQLMCLFIPALSTHLLRVLRHIS